MAFPVKVRVLLLFIEDVLDGQTLRGLLWVTRRRCEILSHWLFLSISPFIRP